MKCGLEFQFLGEQFL